MNRRAELEQEARMLFDLALMAGIEHDRYRYNLDTDRISRGCMFDVLPPQGSKDERMVQERFLDRLIAGLDDEDGVR